MTSPIPDARGNTALDRNLDTQARLAAISALAGTPNRQAVDILLELGERAEEDVEILRAAGSGLAGLLAAGVTVSEWDIRNLTAVAGDAFFDKP